MGFLRRHKVSRECRNKNGKVYNCGYKYMYRITRQGWNYLKYLEERNLLKFTLEDFSEVYRSVQIAIKKLALMELLERNDSNSYLLMSLITEDINRWFSSQGFRQFQMKELLFKQKTTLLAYFYKVILNFENQILLRDLQIKLLIRELRKCKEKHHLGDLNLLTIAELNLKHIHNENEKL